MAATGRRVGSGIRIEVCAADPQSHALLHVTDEHSADDLGESLTPTRRRGRRPVPDIAAPQTS
jgi:hypothetical protein